MDMKMMVGILSGEVRGRDLYFFPTLGQLAFFGVLDEMTTFCNVPSVRSYEIDRTELIPDLLFDEDEFNLADDDFWDDGWFSPEEAWKTANGICSLQEQEWFYSVFRKVKSIQSSLFIESQNFRSFFEKASRNDLKFKLDFADMIDPSEELVAWTKRYLELEQNLFWMKFEEEELNMRKGRNL